MSENKETHVPESAPVIIEPHTETVPVEQVAGTETTGKKSQKKLEKE